MIFILATTEVHKVPATIVSRCQRFDFRRIPSELIAGRLQAVAEQEGIALRGGRRPVYCAAGRRRDERRPFHPRPLFLIALM